MLSVVTPSKNSGTISKLHLIKLPAPIKLTIIEKRGEKPISVVPLKLNASLFVNSAFFIYDCEAKRFQIDINLSLHYCER